MKDLNTSSENVATTIRHVRRALIAGSAKLISRYSQLPRLAKTGIHIAACAGFVWIAFGSESRPPKSDTMVVSSAPTESPGEFESEKEHAVAEAAREALLEAQRNREAEIAEAQRIHAKQQQRLVAEQIQARRKQEAYLERARYLQQLEMQQRQTTQQLHYEAQQGASERANYETQRYRSQMTGRPGF